VDHCRHTKRALAFSNLLEVSQKVTRKWDSVYEKKKKKKKKKKEKRRVSSANIPSVSNRKTTPKKKGSKNNYVAKNANHSSGCWYPHPCPLRWLLGETWADTTRRS
jgi:hypothetical protein